MKPRDEHPRLLLWYVSGDLDPAQRAEVQDHLKGCPGCRAEAEALSSAIRTVEAERPQGAAGSGPGARPAAGAAARRDIPAAQASLPRSSAPLGAGVWLAAAVLLAGIGLAWWVGTSSFPPAAGRGVREVVFTPPLRGGETEHTLEGEGPWAITVLLPFGAPAGHYLVRVEREASPGERALETSASSSPAGSVPLLLEGLPGAGNYRVVLTLEGDSEAEPIVYPFRVIGAVPGAGGRPRAESAITPIRAA